MAGVTHTMYCTACADIGETTGHCVPALLPSLLLLGARGLPWLGGMLGLTVDTASPPTVMTSDVDDIS